MIALVQEAGNEGTFLPGFFHVIPAGPLEVVGLAGQHVGDRGEGLAVPGAVVGEAGEAVQAVQIAGMPGQDAVNIAVVQAVQDEDQDIVLPGHLIKALVGQIALGDRLDQGRFPGQEDQARDDLDGQEEGR